VLGGLIPLVEEGLLGAKSIEKQNSKIQVAE
jgi:hypothetical protein